MNTIVIHHSVTPRDLEGQKSIDSFNRTHRKPEVNSKKGLHYTKNGYGYYIAYHYVIDGSGKVWNTRPEREVGYHASDQIVNANSIGICLTGDFDKETPSKAQLNSLEQLVQEITSRHVILKIIGHRHVEGVTKSCPGRNFTDEMILRLQNNSNKINVWADKIGMPKTTPYEIKEGLNQLFKALEKVYK